jgi:hypothetical protein
MMTADDGEHTSMDNDAHPDDFYLLQGTFIRHPFRVPMLTLLSNQSINFAEII